MTLFLVVDIKSQNVTIQRQKQALIQMAIKIRQISGGIKTLNRNALMLMSGINNLK